MVTRHWRQFWKPSTPTRSPLRTRHIIIFVGDLCGEQNVFSRPYTTEDEDYGRSFGPSITYRTLSFATGFISKISKKIRVHIIKNYFLNKNYSKSRSVLMYICG